MSDISQITNHSEQALGYAAEQDREMPRIEALVEIFATRSQGLENILWQLATERGLDSGIGVQLDGLGDILDWLRGGLSDAAYRLFLKARILAIRSRGRLETLLEILEVLEYTTIASWEQPPAHLQIEACDVVYALETDRILRLAKAGGAGLTFVYSQFDENSVYQASRTYAAEEYDSATGAGSVYDAGTGGQSAGGFR